MQQQFTRLVARCAAAGLLAAPGWSVASDNSATVFPAEGNKTCSDYSSNKVVKAMGVNSPAATGTLTGPDNPNDEGATGETASYTLAGGTTLKLESSSTPIDYAVLKSGTTVSVLIYPAGGVTTDSNMNIPGNLTITAFNLCYGLGNQVVTPPPPPLSVTKSCDDPESAILDETGIACKPGGERTLVCNIELDKPFFGMKDGSDTCCVCNSAPLVECDPNVAYDPNNPDNNACPSPVASGNEVPTIIELMKDPEYCIGAGATRRCYPY